MPSRLARVNERLRASERTTIEIEGETFRFLLSTHGAYIARNILGNGTDQDDPVLALFRVVHRAIELIGRTARDQYEAAQEGTAGLLEDRRPPLARYATVFFTDPDTRNMVQFIDMLVPMFSTETLNDLARVVHWGLLEDDPETTLDDVRAFLSLDRLVKILGVIWPKMVSYQEDLVEDDRGGDRPSADGQDILEEASAKN